MDRDWRRHNHAPKRESNYSSPGRDSSKPCHHFLRTGNCRFGDRCRFSHEPPTQHEQRQAKQNKFQNGYQDENLDGNRDKLRDWTRLLHHGDGTSRTLNNAWVNRFFELGLELMDGDIGASQEAIKLLAGDSGLNFVKAITDQHVTQATSVAAKAKLWETQISPFFRLMTHHRVVDSNVLEQEVATIYSFLVGRNAERVLRLFEFILDLAAAWDDVAQQDTPAMSILELSLSILSKAIDLSTTNIVNQGFQDVVERLVGLVQTSTKTQDDFSALQAKKYLRYLQLRLGVGKSMMENAEPQTAPVKQEQFVLRRDFPGLLSPEGPRHDNDHSEISKIRIMPTYEEIMAPRAEYLPTTDSSQWHLPGIRGRLDREFRLLREDTVGQLREAIHDSLKRVRGTRENIKSRNSARTISYSNASVCSMEMDKNKGLELIVECSQPEVTRQMSDKARQDWWDTSKRLLSGALVCVLDAAGMVQFYVVAESTLRTQRDANRKDKRDKSPHTKPDLEDEAALTLASNRESLFVRLNLVDNSRAELGRAIRWCKEVGSTPPKVLVEFPGVLLASFKHTLEALQSQSQKPDLPFSDLVAPDDSEYGQEVRISAPLFARAPGFVYDLACITKDKSTFAATLQQLPSTDAVSAKTGLDPTQSESLLNTLSRELSLIQGPPGTGKSYTAEKIIQVLLANRDKAKLGPIICVCYTNHALDQLLEHLLDHGVDRIIRMGAGSKSERISGLILREVSQKMGLTKSEKRDNFLAGQSMREHQKECTKLFRQLASCDEPSSIRDHLQCTNRAHHDVLFGPDVDDEGWEIVQNQSKNPVRQWLQGGFGENSEDPVRVRDVATLQLTPLSRMSRPERLRLHRHWVQNIRDPIIAELIAYLSGHQEAKEDRDRIRHEIQHRCLQQAHVIGVTTTGLARELQLLRKLRTKVVVCEEAGEVLEAHLLSTLLPSVEQAILIGDHLQLRPRIQNYDLNSCNPRGVQYSLDTSLFERLVSPPHLADIRLPFSTLDTQRRMHPSISEMVRSTLYNTLTDGENVKGYPEVVGMGRRLFWLNHQRLEAGAAVDDPTSTSHSNEFESEMCAALVSHLVKQGHYSPEDIAVLTPYLGQLHKLRIRLAAESSFAVGIDDRDLEELEVLEEHATGGQEQPKVQNVSKTTLLKSLRIGTVDTFQGLEAKIIIISLVRSNPQSSCGFLSTSNRINVLLSRAKHGCYLIGNAETYKNVRMWSEVIHLLKSNGNFGSSLELQCPRHPETPLLVSRPDDFATLSPDGGCILPCDKRLECGHACYGRCHSELLHKAVKCHEKCQRPKAGCDHACPRECGDVCEDRCNVVLENIDLQLPCGHTQPSAKCWEVQNPAAIRCKAPVEKKVPDCDHTLTLACHIDVAGTAFRCEARCQANLACGHNCFKPCHTCRPRRDGKVVSTVHGTCLQICGRNYIACRHSCTSTCHGEDKCRSCTKPCEVRCSHSRCSKACHEPCAPCAEKDCASHCPHTKCTMPCAAPCNWVPCSKRCPFTLSCGHQCPSICGETCPEANYCQVCGPDDIKSTVVDYLMMGEYKDVDLNEDPCVFPDCRHFLTKSSMDGQMQMGDHYDLDGDGSPTAIKGPSTPFILDGFTVKTCPQCRGSLRSIGRYGRIVRRAMLDESTKKFITWSEERHLQLADKLLQEQLRLENNKLDSDAGVGRPGHLKMTGHIPGQLTQLSKWVSHGRYRSAVKIYMDIYRYRDQVQAKEQPFQRVANFVKHAQGNKTIGNFSFDKSVIQLRGYLLATELLIKCHIAILLDFVKLREEADTNDTEISIEFHESVNLCRELISLAEETDRPQFQAAGHVYYARFCGLELSLRDFQLVRDRASSDEATLAVNVEFQNAERETYVTTGQEHLDKAQSLMDNGGSWPMKQILETEIEAIRAMLKGGFFYQPVSTAELRAVYAAMASEFRGTGHWYTCERGHPFAVGECGLPMQQARCPECGSPVGGQNHIAAAGVRRATELEDLAGGVGEMQI